VKNGLLTDIYIYIYIYPHCNLMHGGSNRIYGLHVTYIHNRLFAECIILDNFRGLYGPKTRTRTCKLVLEDPREQGLSSRTTTLALWLGLRLMRVGPTWSTDEQLTRLLVLTPAMYGLLVCNYKLKY